jgi:hypothetical protein
VGAKLCELRKALRIDRRHGNANAKGRGEHQAVDLRAVTRGSDPRDRAAERGAEHKRARKPERCDQRGGIDGELAQAIGNEGIARAAGIALVIGDHGEVRREMRAKRIEHGMIGFRAVQQQ